MAINSQIVLRVNGREVQDTFNSLQRATRTLRREINQLEPGTEEFIERTTQLRQVEARFRQVRDEIQGTTQDLRESSTEIKNFSDLGSFLGDKFSTGLSGANLSFRGLGTTIKTFAVEAWAAIGSIPIIGWIAAIATGIGLAVKEVFDFNNQFAEANKLTQQYTKLRGEALDKMTVRTQTLEEVLGLDRTEVLEAAKNLVQNFGITYEQAMTEIENGAIKGGKANKEFLDSIREYPTFFAKAGFSAQDFISIVNAGFDLGIYSDKLPDALKEFDLSMREQTKSTRDALVNAFGAAFSDDLLGRVSKGQTTVKDALFEINKESEKYQLSQKQQAQLTADIFRGAGEDVGGFAKIMEAVTYAQIQQGENLTEEQQLIKNQIDNYNELGEAKVDALKSDAVMAFQRDIENAWIWIQKQWYNLVAVVRNSITFFRAGFESLAEYSLVLSSRITGVFRGVSIDIANITGIIIELGKALGSALTLDFDAVEKSVGNIKERMKNSFAGTKKAFGEFGRDSGVSFINNYNKILESDKLKANAQRIINTRRENANKKTNNFDGTAGNNPKANAKKLAAENEKLRKEFQKDLEDSENDLEKSEKRKQDLKNQYRSEEIALMKEGLQKELAQADFARAQELQKLSANGEEIQAQILKLEKKKLEAKSPVAKANYDKALKEELEARSQNVLLIEKTEQTHQLKLKTIREKASAQQIETDANQMAKQIENTRRASEQEIINITSLQVAKEKLRNNEFQKMTDQELDAITSLEEAKDALREEANKKMIDQQRLAIEVQISLLKEALNDPSLSEDAIKKTASNLDFLIDKLHQLEAAKDGKTKSKKEKYKEENDKVKGQIDILGFSAKDWEDSFTNVDTLSEKLKAAGMIFKALGEAATLFGDLQRAVGERELKNFTRIQKAKKAQLDKNLASGLISQEEYNKRTEAMDIELANKQAEIEYKQAKADKISKLFGAIGATALGVANALSAGPAGIVLAAIVGALGAVQVATIAAQPLPEKPSFAEGGFTGNGFGFPDKTGFKQAGVVHENEWVAPEWMTTHPRISKDIKRLEFMRQNGPSSYADGGYTETSSNSANTTTATASESNDSLRALFVRLLGIFQRIDDNGGLEAYIVDNPQNQKKVYEMSKKRQSLENKNKH